MNNPRHPLPSVPFTLPSAQPHTTQPPSPTPTPRITTKAENLLTFDPTSPILRFNFPNAATQASFHRAFALLLTTRNKAAFLSRFAENFDAQVNIPKKPVRWDTSGDEELAKELWDGAEMDVGNDGELAQRLQGETQLPDTRNDEGLARELWNGAETDTSRDEHFARMMQEQMRPDTEGDADVARRMAEDMNPRDRTRELDEDFGRLTFAERRRRADGRRDAGGQRRR
ncbi:hypothetical protein CC86DRAFT_406048 [Ophiobolus disseminans]|uniref:Uncharacterized protein n=1 Tax=Ophiobolus disseminans TaxID=1469910 RepID=A0A6A7A2L4_9PLEO|nr:hypothetical protein CC86DRAFT_406048 [Ophiobolus disseminans]